MASESIDERWRGRRIRWFASGAEIIFEYEDAEESGRLWDLECGL